jgi:hypothetical protein
MCGGEEARFVGYTNGKSAVRLREGVVPAGSHRFTTTAAARRTLQSRCVLRWGAGGADVDGTNTDGADVDGTTANGAGVGGTSADGAGVGGAGGGADVGGTGGGTTTSAGYVAGNCAVTGGYGVQSGVESGVESGIQSGVESGVQSGVRSGVHIKRSKATVCVLHYINCGRDEWQRKYQVGKRLEMQCGRRVNGSNAVW